MSRPRWWITDRFTPIELSRRRDVDLGAPRGKLVRGLGPGLVWSFRCTLIETPSSLIRRELEEVDHDDRANFRCCLPRSRLFVSASEAKFDNDMGADLERAHPCLDQWTRDHV